MTRLAAALLLFAATAAPAAAIDFGLGLFKKKPKAEPPTRVKQLVATLQTDPDESKRLTAAEELRSFDPRNNPDMVPALIGSLQQDPSPAVRSEAAETLGRLKPVEQPAGLALEAAQTGDPSPAVREAAKSALWQYHLNGYRPPAANAGDRAQTAEPPLAARRTTVAKKPASDPAAAGFRPISNSLGRAATFHPTAEPPLAKAKAAPEIAAPIPGGKPAVSATPVSLPKAVPSIGAPTLTPPPPTFTPPPTLTLPPGGLGG